MAFLKKYLEKLESTLKIMVMVVESKLSFGIKIILSFHHWVVVQDFKKRVKILGVSGWQKSYATQIELGVNDISYEYNFNVPVYNAAKYNYENFFIEINGVKYAGSGKQMIEFPSGAANFPYVGTSPQEITVHILRQDLLTVKYDANKVYNQIVDLAVKEAFNKIKSYNPALKDVADKVEKG